MGIEQLLAKTTFEAASTILAFGLGIIMLYNTWFFIALFRGSKQVVKFSLGRKIYYIPKAIFIVIKPNIWKVLLLNILLAAAVGIYVKHYFYTRPYVVYQNPAANSPWTDFTQPLTIVFDKPVNTEEVEFNISPEIPGEVIWEPTIAGLSRTLTFVPAESIPPETEVWAYIVDIGNLTSTDGIHEAAVEVESPQLPEVQSYSVPSAENQMLPDSTIDVHFSSPTGDFVDFEFTLEPEADIDINKLSTDRWQLSFPEHLDQGTSYILTVNRAAISTDLTTNEVISRSDFEKISDFKFSTVKTPGVKSITPSGKGVNPNNTIVINFDLPMDKSTVQSNWKIEPEIRGAFNWKSDTKMEFKPGTPFAKDTKYTLVVGNGVRSVAGGEILSDITHTFTTAGPVKVTSISPSNGSSGISRRTNITVKFDQPVDKASAQNKFSIKPNVNGKFSWDGKTKMTFNPNNLAFSTRYTITLASGVKSQYGLSSKESFSSKFTTASDTFILNMAWYGQQERFTCNVAATRMVLAYRGIYKSEYAVKSGLGVGQSLSGGSGGDPYKDWINGYGTYWTNVSAYLSKYRRNTVKRNWNIPDMLREVRRGNPVILWWQNDWSSWYWKSWTTPEGKTVRGLNGMHSEIVIGYKGDIENPSTIITRDPWRQTRYYTKSKFDSLWKNSFSRTGIVVY